MFSEGDLVKLTNLDPDVKAILANALGVRFEEIEFYFIEYEDDNYAVLSAETDKKFAIVHCPVEAIEGVHNDAEEVEKLIDHVINTWILDRALEQRDKALFDAIMEYRNQKAKELPKETSPQHVYMDILYDEDDDYWEDWDDDDWETEYL